MEESQEESDVKFSLTHCQKIIHTLIITQQIFM